MNLIKKYRLKVCCNYLPIPEWDETIVNIEVCEDEFDDIDDLKDNTVFLDRVEKELSQMYDIEDFDIEEIEQIGQPYIDFTETQKRFEATGQLRLPGQSYNDICQYKIKDI